MLDRQAQIYREGNRIRMMRNEGRLVFKADGTLDIAPPEGALISPEVFNRLVDVYAGGSTPDTNACLYFIKWARARTTARANTAHQRSRVNVQVATQHAPSHLASWLAYYESCVNQFAQNSQAKPPVLPEDLQSLISQGLDARGYSGRWDLSHGVLQYVTLTTPWPLTRVMRQALREEEPQHNESKQESSSSASNAISSHRSSSSYLYSVLSRSTDDVIVVKRQRIFEPAQPANSVLSYEALAKDPAAFMQHAQIDLATFEALYSKITEATDTSALASKWQAHAWRAHGMSDRDRLLVVFLLMSEKNRQNHEIAAGQRVKLTVSDDVARKAQVNGGNLYFLKMHFVPLMETYLHLASRQVQRNAVSTDEMVIEQTNTTPQFRG